MTVTDPISGLRALADPTRLAMARLLVEGAFNVGELQEVLSLGQSTVSHHLKILADAGLLSCRREGRLAYYQWQPALPPALEALRLFVQQHGGDIDPEARRRLHRVFLSRSERTRRYFDGPAAQALLMGQASERAAHASVDVVGRMIAHLPPVEVAVDLGTGAGRLLAPLHARAKRVIGIDASPRMLESAGRLVQEAGLSHVELRLGTLEHLPLRDGEADAAVAHLVLHHAARPEEVLAEAKRALKPGGRLVVGDYLPHEQEWMREELADQWLGFDPGQIARLLEAAGFTDVEVETVPGARDALGMFVARGCARDPASGLPVSQRENSSRKSKPPPRRVAGLDAMPRASTTTMPKASTKTRPKAHAAARGDKR